MSEKMHEALQRIADSGVIGYDDFTILREAASVVRRWEDAEVVTLSVAPEKLPGHWSELDWPQFTESKVRIVPELPAPPGKGEA